MVHAYHCTAWDNPIGLLPMDTSRSWLSRHITLHDGFDASAEKENSVTHLAGTLCALLFLIIVLVRWNTFASPLLAIGMLVQGATLILLYFSSTLYHHLPPSDAKRLFRLLDHANIYLLIAGTYTPILLYIGSPTALFLLVSVWLVALAGILFSLLFWGRLKPLHIVFYLAMGWMIIFFWDAVTPHLSRSLIGYIIAGGLTYSIGVLFYALKRVPHNHMIWHLFCVAASAIFCIGFLRHLH